MKRRNVLAAIATIPMLNGCRKSEISWTEEVQITGGEIIIVKRTAKTKAFGEIGGPGGWENEGMTVEVIKPSLKDKPPIWAFPFVPLLFDQDAQTKQWLMVATFYSCTSWYDLGRPKLPYTEYRLVNGQWTQKPLSLDLIGRPANMLTSINSNGERDHTLATKAVAMSDPTVAAKYLQILGKWSTGC